MFARPGLGSGFVRTVPDHKMTAGKVALLIADLAGSTTMYEQLGDDAARVQITGCLEQLAVAAQSHGGRVVKSLGDGVLCVFPEVEPAFRAAIAMRQAAAFMGLVLRAGLHFGPVAEDAVGDVFGDAVNTVARVCDVAAHAEIMLTHEVYRRLLPERAAQLQPLPPVALKGKRELLQLFALHPPRSGASTASADLDAMLEAAAPSRLRIAYCGRDWDCGDEPLVLGRSEDCDVVLATARASRRHAKVFRMGSNWYVADTSSNGTWLVTGPEPAIRLHRERSPLIGSGRIYCGVDPDAPGAAAITYRVGRAT